MLNPPPDTKLVTTHTLHHVHKHYTQTHNTHSSKRERWVQQNYLRTDSQFISFSKAGWCHEGLLSSPVPLKPPQTSSNPLLKPPLTSSKLVKPQTAYKPLHTPLDLLRNHLNRHKYPQTFLNLLTPPQTSSNPV